MTYSDNNLPPLRSQQSDAINFIQNNFDSNINTLCAMGVGTGKTRVACEVIRNHIENTDGYVLVCCPNVALIYTPWIETLEKMNLKTRHLSDVEFRSNIFGIKKVFNAIPKYIYLITYKMLISESYEIENYVFFKNNPPSMIVFDEMHYLSNNPPTTKDDDSDESVNTKQSRIAALSINAKKKLGLTATPIVNRHEELMSACEILNGRSIDSKVFVFEADSNYDLTKVNQFFVEIPFSDDEYESLKGLAFLLNDNMLPEKPLSQKLLICKRCNFRGVNITLKHSSKNIVLRTILEHIPKNDKILIFDEIRASLDYLSKKEWMKEFHPIVYHGGISKRLQKKLYEQFLEKPKHRVFMATRQIAGEGLNLQIANHIIMLSFGWTPKDIIQTAGRIKRIGQKKDVFIYILKGNYYLVELLTNHKFFEQYRYKIIKKKIKEINENLENTYELGFQRTSEVFPKLFKKNESLREDTAKFIDSVQKEYIDKENLLQETIKEIEEYSSTSNKDKHNILVDLLKNGLPQKANWNIIEKLCRYLLKGENLTQEDFKDTEIIVDREIKPNTTASDLNLAIVTFGFFPTVFDRIVCEFIRYLDYCIKSAD